MRTQHIRSIALTFIVVLAAPLSALAQEAGTLDPELVTRCQLEIKKLKARGMNEAAQEMQRQFDAFANNPKVHEQVIQETRQRLTQAREAFNKYYQQLVAEGETEGAERMKKLFEISLTGAPLTNPTAPATPVTP